MKSIFIIIFLLLNFFIMPLPSIAQCSICTKTAQQLGDGPAQGLNSGIIYLAFIPMLIIGYIGFRWWRNEKSRNNM